VFGFPGELVVCIPDKASFYSLYADGQYSRKTYVKDTGQTLIAYPPDAVVFLYYTYPTFRAASVICNAPGRAALPGLSKKVRLLFTVHASRVDKLKRAAAFLNKNAGGACRFDGGFYTRLYFILRQRGTLNYPALRKLANVSTKPLLERSKPC
jgi:hypothetical protein